MELVIQKISFLLSSAKTFFGKADEGMLTEKISDDNWSRKEILGHLIDSAINNIQRFTEIQNAEKPYPIRRYHQDELVKANDYQNRNTEDLFKLWQQLNLQVLHIIKNQSKETLNYPLILPNGETKDLNFLIRDYVEHLEHHLDQIYH